MYSPDHYITPCLRRALAACAVVLLVGLWSSVTAEALQVDPAAAVEAADVTQAAESHSILPTVAKVFNFALLVGILVYFLRTPIVQYLAARHTTIRRDLVDAKALSTQAEAQLTSVRARLAELPAELEALQARGAEELANERVRMKAATAGERDKLIERTRREIDVQFRVARRELIERTADLAIGLARTRIQQSITADDQSRLVERYAAEVRA